MAKFNFKKTYKEQDRSLLEELKNLPDTIGGGNVPLTYFDNTVLCYLYPSSSGGAPGVDYHVYLEVQMAPDKGELPDPLVKLINQHNLTQVESN